MIVTSVYGPLEYDFTCSALVVDRGGLYLGLTRVKLHASTQLSDEQPRPLVITLTCPVPRRSNFNATWGSAVAGHWLPNL